MYFASLFNDYCYCVLGFCTGDQRNSGKEDGRRLYTCSRGGRELVLGHSKFMPNSEVVNRTKPQNRNYYHTSAKSISLHCQAFRDFKSSQEKFQGVTLGAGESALGRAGRETGIGG